jgi:peptidoglycan/xylan/chitin deacetylase (PgdA/CDA1 family)
VIETAPGAVPGLTWQSLVKRQLLSSGYYGWRLRQSAFPGIAVLCYHGIRRDAVNVPFADLHVTAAGFDRQCATLARLCSPVSLAQIEAARAGGPPLPDRAVLVTFDDGYSSVLTEGLPILERYGIPAVVFVCTDPIERNELFWFDATALNQGEAAVAIGRGLPFADWQRRLVTMSSLDERHAAHRPLTVAELQRLAAHPLIDIGAHTLNHPTLVTAPVAEQRRQIAGSRDRVAALTGRTPRAFAYPYGLRDKDYGDDAVALVREAGFDAAFTTSQAFAGAGANPWERPRFVMLASVTAAELAHRLAHSWPRPAA